MACRGVSYPYGPPTGPGLVLGREGRHEDRRQNRAAPTVASPPSCCHSSFRVRSHSVYMVLPACLGSVYLATEAGDQELAGRRPRHLRGERCGGGELLRAPGDKQVTFSVFSCALLPSTQDAPGQVCPAWSCVRCSCALFSPRPHPRPHSPFDLPRGQVARSLVTQHGRILQTGGTVNHSTTDSTCGRHSAHSNAHPRRGRRMREEERRRREARTAPVIAHNNEEDS